MLKLFSVLISVIILIGCNTKDINNTVQTKEIEKQTKKTITPIKTEQKIVKKQEDIKQKEIKQKIEKKIVVKKTVVKKKNIIPKKKIKSVKTSTVLDKHNLDNFAFDLIKKGKTDDNTFLVVGGIQGDEPGGFMAASLMSTHYKITKGSVWIVPNLNFYSIIKRSRGPFGDMNRKFAYLPKSDPEYNIIQRIKKYITDPKVKLIANLHDGSGFYRPMYIDKMHQPRKWGQSLVIDQEILPNVKKYADTFTISEKIVDHLNKYLLKDEDIYRTKNTHTRFKKTNEEQEMAKTLTYYAIQNGKSAFGHETSKSLTVPQRVYYKLLALEKFMDIMGIEYTRKFPMTIESIKKVLNEDISIKFDDTHISMPLKDIRNSQRYFPVDTDGLVRYLPSNPLIKIIKQKNEYIIYYGNRRLTRLQADYAEHLNFNTKVNFVIDGKTITAKFGDTISVDKTLLVGQPKEFRVNIIGYKTKLKKETNHTITKDKFAKRFSIERNGKMYRIEYYKKDKFAGMVLVKFN